MKRKIVILLAAALLLSGCGKSVDEPVQTATAQTSQTVAEPEAAPVPSGEVLDLTKLSSTMVRCSTCSQTRIGMWAGS